MHRETFHLAVEFIDRYLENSVFEVPKSQLQLIGITSLFVAAKIEEIYPQKINEFAYVTDGACTIQDILDHELVLLKVSVQLSVHTKFKVVTVLILLLFYAGP